MVSMFFKSIWSKSKNSLSSTSTSETFATPLTSISFCPDSHLPKILLIINDSFVCFSICVIDNPELRVPTSILSNVPAKVFASKTLID